MILTTLLTQDAIKGLTDYDAALLTYLCDVALAQPPGALDMVRFPDPLSWSDVEVLRDLLGIKPQLIRCPGEECGLVLYPLEDLNMGNYEDADGKSYDYEAICGFCSHVGPKALSDDKAVEAFIEQALAAENA